MILKRGEKITGITDKGQIGVGTVHTIDDERFFVQIRVRGGPAINCYYRYDEESAKWIRGEQDETSAAALLAAFKLVES